MPSYLSLSDQVTNAKFAEKSVKIVKFKIYNIMLYAQIDEGESRRGEGGGQFSPVKFINSNLVNSHSKFTKNRPLSYQMLTEMQTAYWKLR